VAKRRSNQEGTLYQRKDGRWCAQVSLNGRRPTHYADSVSMSFPAAPPQARGRAESAVTLAPPHGR
jgi:hypothetical protein